MLYPIDKNGFVINEASAHKVEPKYATLIGDILEISKKNLKDYFRSFYVRGSVSVGKAIHGLSDLDTIIVIWRPLEDRAQKEISSEIRHLEKLNEFVTFIDVTIVSFEELMQSSEFTNLQIYLKTQSYCVYGENILKHLPDVRPGPSLASAMSKNLNEELKDLRATIVGTKERRYLGQKKPTEFWVVWAMRVMIRSGLGLVMMSESVYSQDLITCCEVFCKKFPEHEAGMKTALKYSIKPRGDRVELLTFLDDFTPKLLGLWSETINTYEHKI